MTEWKVIEKDEVLPGNGSNKGAGEMNGVNASAQVDRCSGIIHRPLQGDKGTLCVVATGQVRAKRRGAEGAIFGVRRDQFRPPQHKWFLFRGKTIL